MRRPSAAAQKRARDYAAALKRNAFRHAFAVTWLQRGGDISRLQRTLGHGTAKVTMDYYMTWSDSDLRDAHKDYSPRDNGGQ